MIEFTEQLNLKTGWKDNQCPYAEEIKDFGYNLYPEQKQVLYLMKELENQEFIQQEDKKIYYNKIRFGAPFSFGKTIVSLALIKSDNNPIEHKMFSFFNNVSKSTICEVSELYVQRNKYIDTTLILISSSILNQWVSHITKVNLNALIIDTLEDFENLCVKLINNDLNNFDLVLLVYRKLKLNYPLPFGINHFHWSEHSNITLLSILSIDKIWKRVMIDDFDTINIYYDISIPAKMTWLISATNNSLENRDRDKSNNNIYHTCNCFKISSINHRIMDALRDPYIQELTIRTDLNVVLPKIQIYCYMFEFGGTVNQVLNNLNYSTEVCEKINSGDISGAATLLGMSKDCQSMGEFLYLLINRNKTSYMDCLKMYEKIENFFTLIQNNDRIIIRELPREEGEEINGEYNCPNLCIRNDEVWNQYVRDLENNNQFITTIEMRMIRILSDNCKENAGNFKNVLERIKRNIEDGLCGKCYCEIEDEKFILQCCNIILCKYCILKHDSNIFIDRCPNCIKKLDKHNLLQLPKDISLEEFINLDFEEAFVKLRNFNRTQINVEDLSELSPKEQALLNILNNKTPQKCIEKKYDGLDMNGVIETNQVIENNDINSKFIIFTKWQYCAYSLSELLRKHNINNLILRGTNTKNINKTILKFKNNPNFNVLLIASNDICSGLNLEFVTHMIFYHSIRSIAVTAQIIGRCQRIGRKKSLKLISLQHRHEVSVLYR